MKNTPPLRLSCFVLATSLAVPVLAQNDANAARRGLHAAIVLEEHERDLAAARTAYEELVRSADASVRATATKRLAALQERLADSATTRKTEQSLVDRAIEKLRSPQVAVQESGLDDLSIAGARAVPRLAERLADPEIERVAIVRGAQALAKIQDPSATAALIRLIENASEARRLAIFEGLDFAHDRALENHPSALLALAGSAEPDLKCRVLGHFSLAFDVERLCAEIAAGDRPGRVQIRLQALSVLADRNEKPAELGAITDRLLPLVAPDVERGDSDTAVAVLRFGYVGSEAWRALWLRALAALDARATVYGDLPAHALAPRDFAALVPIAERTRALGTEPRRSVKTALLWRVIQATEPKLGPDAVEIAIALAGAGFGELLHPFVRRHVTAAHGPALVKAARTSGDWELLEIARKQETLAAAALPDLRALLEERAKGQADAIRPVLDLIARIRTKEAIAFLLARAQQESKEPWGGFYLVEPLLRAASDPVLPEAEAALVEALRIPNLKHGEVVWARLMEIGSQAAIELYPKALATHGALESLPPGVFLANSDANVVKWSGLSWLFQRSQDGKSFHGYREADVVRILALCWEEPSGEGKRQILGYHAWFEHFPKATLEMLCRQPVLESERNALAFTEALLRTSLTPDGEWSDAVLALCRHVLERSHEAATRTLCAVVARVTTLTPDVRGLLERMLDHPQAVASAFATLAKNDAPAALAAARARLTHADAEVRRRARQELMLRLGKDAVPELLSARDEKASQHRSELADWLGRFADRRAVPTLLALLRDTDSNVSAVAQASLAKIRFVEEQESFWQRLSEGTPVSSQSAAEALLKQAAKDQPKPVRLVAIDSLGSLGVPETLPFLIEMLRDQDAELAARAANAIEKINAKKR